MKNRLVSNSTSMWGLAMNVSSSQNSKTLKTEIRRAFRARERQAMLPTELALKQANLNARLVEFFARRSAGATVGAEPEIWAAFQPIEGEPDIRSALNAVKSVVWVYPRVDCEYLSFSKLNDKNQLLQSSLGILEPDADAEEVPLNQIAGFLVPGLAFDLAGMRMGRGRGFYDRTLGDPVTRNSLKIGIAFHHQVSTQPLPAEAHDVAMDFVLTDIELLENPSRKKSL